MIGDSCVISAMVDGKCSPWVTCGASLNVVSECKITNRIRDTNYFLNTLMKINVWFIILSTVLRTNAVSNETLIKYHMFDDTFVWRVLSLFTTVLDV